MNQTAHELDLLATGFPSIDYIFRVRKLPRVGETATITTLGEGVHVGGCGINVAVGLARLGIRAGVACVVGDGADAHRLLGHLEREKVDTRGVTVVPGAPTSRSYLFADDQATMTFFLPGAAAALPGEPDLSGLPPCAWGLVTVGEPRYNRAFIRTLRARGVPVAVQLRIDEEAYGPFLAEAVKSASLLFMNEYEACFLVKRLGLARIEELLSEVTRAVVVTRGAQGAAAYTHEGHVEVAAVQPACVVDTTGAGDAFTAGFLAGIRWGLATEDALRLAATMASFVVERVGAQEGLPDRQRLAERLAAVGEVDLARRLLTLP
ncbi:MAG TPA: PfkB family carbohydrate kinase [Limnochorda sp.]